MSLQPKPHLSFDEWLAGERASLDHRYEYFGGEVFAVSGGTFWQAGLLIIAVIVVG